MVPIFSLLVGFLSTAAAAMRTAGVCIQETDWKAIWIVWASALLTIASTAWLVSDVATQKMPVQQVNLAVALIIIDTFTSICWVFLAAVPGWNGLKVGLKTHCPSKKLYYVG